MCRSLICRYSPEHCYNTNYTRALVAGLYYTDLNCSPALHFQLLKLLSPKSSQLRDFKMHIIYTWTYTHVKYSTVHIYAYTAIWQKDVHVPHLPSTCINKYISSHGYIGRYSTYGYIYVQYPYTVFMYICAYIHTISLHWSLVVQLWATMYSYMYIQWYWI